MINTHTKPATRNRMREVETNPASKLMAKLNPDTLLRQWQMLRHDSRFPQKITAGDLHLKLQAEPFDVTRRTVQA